MVKSPVAIIGMHRSGTSCLAGCLEDLGLSLGSVNTAAPHNKKGNRENPRFWPVHDAVLARVGAAWDTPPAAAVVWTSAELDDLRAVLNDYADLVPPWGVKDPRATSLLDGWFQVVPDLNWSRRSATPGRGRIPRRAKRDASGSGALDLGCLQ